MTCTLHVAWDERLTDYHFGPGHPMAPVRVELTMRLAHEFGLWSQSGVTVAVPAPAADADLELVHDPSYVAAVEAVSRWAEHPDASQGLEGTQLRVARMFGLGTEDNPVFPGMHEASALVAGATLAAARARLSTGPASRAACIMPWPRTPAGSASTTTR
jgi:acetoin utilization protein AcuC